ncbi:MAG: multicopper oxidase domain-containing protein, partial [Proteobacteria bacterium]|nr:multicopper oxidase domain-containing protein [Pseudomonadota bacterium]
MDVTTVGKVSYANFADTIDWWSSMTGDLFTADHEVFVGDGPGVIGRTYTKSVYREYSGGFPPLAAAVPREDHLGILGPNIRAEVGDTIVVHFRNDTSEVASVHPHGVRYEKGSEGAPYDDGTYGADKG